MSDQCDERDTEKQMLIQIILGNYKYGEQFKEWCKKHFTEEYLKSCIESDEGLIGQYFKEEDFEDQCVNCDERDTVESPTTCGFSGCFNSIDERGNNPFPFILPKYSLCCDECYGSKIVPFRESEGNGNDLKRGKM